MRKILSSKTPGVLNNVHYNTSVTEFCRRLIKPTVLFLCTENMFYLVGFVDSSLLIAMESVTQCIAERLLCEPPNFRVFYIVCVWGGAGVVKRTRCFRVECQMASKFYILGGGGELKRTGYFRVKHTWYYMFYPKITSTFYPIPQESVCITYLSFNVLL